jgi:hypothetical protein
MKSRILIAAIAALALSALADAQTLVLTASPTSADVRATPTLSWSGVPSTAVCTAVGGWTGTKASSGVAVAQTEITKTTRYSLNCSWPAVAATNGSALVSWAAPIANTDGTPLGAGTGPDDLAGFRVMYGTAATNLDQSVYTPNAAARSLAVPSLAPNTWYFAVRAVNGQGLESANSNVATKVVTGTGGSPAGFSSAYVDVVIHPAPMPPTIVTVAIVSTQQVAPLYRVLGKAGAYYPGEMFGMVEAGRACEAAQVFKYRGASFHRVTATADDVWPKTASTANLAAPCA